MSSAAPSATRIANDVGRGALRARDVVDAALARARAHAATDGEGTNSIVELFEDSARHAADAVDAAPVGTRGPLAGVPFLIKDNLLYQGHRVGCASRMLEGFVAPYSATSVTRLTEAGAIVLGRTNMDEFGMGSTSERSLHGRVRHPVDPDRTAGGSSGGSAAAVAADVVPLALGSDTGGSVRQPAAFCGVLGFKPTWGRVSRHGLVALSSSMDTVGTFARDATDLFAACAAVAGHDPHDATSYGPRGFARTTSTGTVRIGVPAWLMPDGGRPEQDVPLADDTVLESVRARLARASDDPAAPTRLELVPVSLPDLRPAVSTYYVCCTAEASTNLARFDGVRYGHRAADPSTLHDLYERSRTEGFGAEVRRRILVGTFCLQSGYLEDWYLQAARVRALYARAFAQLFDAHGLAALALPTAPTAALPAGTRLDDPLAMYAEDVLTVPASLVGLPAVSVPCRIAGTPGLTAGLQLVGRRGDDVRLLELCARPGIFTPGDATEVRP